MKQLPPTTMAYLKNELAEIENLSREEGKATVAYYKAYREWTDTNPPAFQALYMRMAGKNADASEIAKWRNNFTEAGSIFPLMAKSFLKKELPLHIRKLRNHLTRVEMEHENRYNNLISVFSSPEFSDRIGGDRILDAREFIRKVNGGAVHLGGYDFLTGEPQH